MDTSSQTKLVQEKLKELFGGYKAEWLKDRLFDLFAKPSYYPELITDRPCVLVGGRGTGKTTVLKCLSYEGQYLLSKTVPEDVPEWAYYGFYYRVNTNHVTAFEGTELSPVKWRKCFAHYINLILSNLILEFLNWYEELLPDSVRLSSLSLQNIATLFGIEEEIPNVNILLEKLSEQRVIFERYINNLETETPPTLTLQGVPLNAILSAVKELPQFSDKKFFFLIDEYENFLDDQQRVMNTLIKHSDENYTFKIGVRELGWRQKTTLNENEQLVSPADYVMINISETLSSNEVFGDFALNVCNSRIQKATEHLGGGIQDVKDMLEDISPEDEAQLLGVSAKVKKCEKKVRNILRKAGDEKDVSDLFIYFLVLWAEKENLSVYQLAEECLSRPNEWKTRYENYKHAILYTIASGKGDGVKKYYCGWSTFIQISSGNIRYLLELLDQSLMAHLQQGNDLNQPISCKTQTSSCQKIGGKNLRELEGLSIHGAKLTKLLLGMGRVFDILAKKGLGHAPEVNQFYFDTSELKNETKEILDAAVMHLALIRSPGNKPSAESDTKEWTYSLHPIFSPFFVFSYRRKRKTRIEESDILGLIEAPKKTLPDILNRKKIDTDAQGVLPDQLHLFETYYANTRD